MVPLVLKNIIHMNKSKRSIFDSWLIITLLITSVVFCYAFYREYSKNSAAVENNKQDTVSTIEIEGSKSSLYVLEDTSTGMIWIGIPGINRVNKK